MTKPTNQKFKNHTLNDVKLAELYFPILVDLAINKHQLTYKELVETARRLNPDKEIMKTAIPVSTGRKLACIHSYCVQLELPILPSLIISKESGSVGVGSHDLEGVGDPIAELNRVYAFDWSTVKVQFEKYLTKAEKDATPKKRLTKETAIQIMSDYFMNNKENLPSSLKVERDCIIANIMDGESVEDAFDEAIGNL